MNGPVEPSGLASLGPHLAFGLIPNGLRHSQAPNFLTCQQIVISGL
jgi:hypothetical protein